MDLLADEDGRVLERVHSILLKALASTTRHAKSFSMVRHPSTGQNLLMSGTDRLNGGTDTPTISQRSESGQVILDSKEG
jgi:hypothetical protein